MLSTKKNLKKKNLRCASLVFFGIHLLFWSNFCQAQTKPSRQLVLDTDEGSINFVVFDATPLHSSNFQKLVAAKFYDSTLFHRVIPGFMIQGGDPSSKKAGAGQMLGGGDIGYKIPAEINPLYFHKKGAVAAARDNNPDKSSSGCQFYIVIGTVYTDSLLTLMENSKNAQLKQQFFKTFIDKPENAGLKNTFISLQQRGNRDSLILLSKKVEPVLDSAFAKMPHFMFSAAQRKAYTTIGGAPHLDGEYTVFGEVVAGLEVLDKLAMVPRDEHDRPLKDIRMTVAKKIKD